MGSLGGREEIQNKSGGDEGTWDVERAKHEMFVFPEMAQIRWNLIFDGDEKALAMVASCTFR